MIMEKKNKPRFNVPNLGFFRSVKARWRKPRGTHNKKRMKFKFMGASPKIGYRNPESMRDLHPSGMREAYVSNPKDLEGLKDVVLRIASSVGGKKRKLIEEKAKALHLRIVNLAGGEGNKAKEAKNPKWQKKEPSMEGRKAANAKKASEKQKGPAQKAHKK
jgi:large subunit ribosomal protein L32e